MTFKWTSPAFTQNPTTTTVSDIEVKAYFEAELPSALAVTSSDLETLVKENLKKEIENIKTTQKNLVQITSDVNFWLPMTTTLTETKLADTTDTDHQNMITTLTTIFDVSSGCLKKDFFSKFEIFI